MPSDDTVSRGLLCTAIVLGYDGRCDGVAVGNGRYQTSVARMLSQYLYLNLKDHIMA